MLFLQSGETAISLYMLTCVYEGIGVKMGLEDLNVMQGMRRGVNSFIGKYIVIPTMSGLMYFGIGCGGDKGNGITDTIGGYDLILKSNENKLLDGSIGYIDTSNPDKPVVRINSRAINKDLNPMGIAKSSSIPGQELDNDIFPV